MIVLKEKYYSIKKTLLTHYYKLDWSDELGNKEKIYLAIRGKINKDNPMLYLEIRNVSELWHETFFKKIEKISRAEFRKNATGNNVARFYDLEYNNLLNYSPKIWKELEKYNWGDDYGKSYRKAKMINNKKSIKDELKDLKRNRNEKEGKRERGKKLER